MKIGETYFKRKELMKNYGEDLDWELGVDFPEWGNNEIYVKTISKGSLLCLLACINAYCTKTGQTTTSIKVF